jgi:type I restriction enzyme, R subunit
MHTVGTNDRQSLTSPHSDRLLGVEIAASEPGTEDATGRVDLSAIDFEALAAAFTKAPRTTVEQLRSDATQKVHEIAARNPKRADLIDKLEKLIDDYNSATANVEETFERLKEFLRNLDAEEHRAAREDLTEDELAIYDLLTRPEPKLTKAQEVAVKKVARDLLAKLQDAVSVFQWRQRQQPRATVRSLIEVVLNTLPEEPYPGEMWNEKVEATWEFILARYGAAESPGLDTSLH